MPIRVFCIPARASHSDEESELNDFLSRHRIVSMTKEFVPDGQNSFWSLCVDFLPQVSEKADRSHHSGKGSEVDYRDVLSPENFIIYSDLRELRKAIAARAGVPIYTIFTNRQLADLITQRVTAKQAFAKVDGVGTSRTEKYGAEFIQRLQEHFNGQHATSEQPVPKDP